MQIKTVLLLGALISLSCFSCVTATGTQTALSDGEMEVFSDLWNTLKNECLEANQIVFAGSVFWKRGSSAFDAVFEMQAEPTSKGKTDHFRMAFVSPFGNTVSEIFLRSEAADFECTGNCPTNELEIFGRVAARDLRAIVCGSPALLEDAFESKKEPDRRADHVREGLQLRLVKEKSKLGGAPVTLLETAPNFAGAKPAIKTYFSQSFFEKSHASHELVIVSQVSFGWLFKSELNIEWHGCKRNGTILPSRIAIHSEDRKNDIFINEFESVKSKSEEYAVSNGQNCNISE